MENQAVSQLEEKVTVDLGYYLNLKKQANDKQAILLALQALIFQEPGKCSQILEYQGIDLRIEGNATSFKELAFDLGFDNFDTIQKAKEMVKGFEPPIVNKAEELEVKELGTPDELSELSSNKEEERGTRTTDRDFKGVPNTSRFA